MSDFVQSHRRQPTRLPRPWDSPGKNTGVGCHFLLQCMKVKVKSLSCVRPLATSWTAAYQAPPSMGFARQEYWSGLPLPSPISMLLVLKTLPANAGDLGSITGLGRSPGEGNGNPLQYSCLANPMDGVAWWATVHGVAKSRTRLSDFTSLLYC